MLHAWTPLSVLNCSGGGGGGGVARKSWDTGKEHLYIGSIRDEPEEILIVDNCYQF